MISVMKISILIMEFMSDDIPLLVLENMESILYADSWRIFRV